jgi:hypothetical protein
MKRVVLFLISSAVVVGAGWLALDLASGQSKEKSITLTEQQWEDLIQKRVAQALAKDQVSHERIVQSQNWHRAIFNGVEYTVYTGPGQVLATRWAQVPAQPKEPSSSPARTPAKKTESP